MPRPHTSRIKLYKDVPEEAKRGVCCHIVNVQEFLVTLSRIRRITLCEAELQQVDFNNLECGLERINPTVVCVARTLDELGLDDALRVLLPYAPNMKSSRRVSGLDREALSANITQRRSRQAVTSESSDFEAVSQFKMPTRPLNASTRSSTLATVIVRKEETAAHDELQNSSDFDHLLHILLSFETARFNTGLMRFEQGLVDPFSVVSGQVDRVSRRCTDLARQVFVCSPDDCDSTKAALTELSTLLQFRHPNITPLIAYAFNEALCQEDILVLELYTPWYTGGTLRSLLISSEIASISADRRLDILCKVAKVLAFMHSEDPYSASHGNLSSAKVLLSHEQEPVLSDFTSSVCSCGPSVLTESTDLNSELASSQSSAAGVPTTLRESMRSDCFKFATLCLEVWLHQEPEPGAWYPPDESISSLKLAERVSEQFHETGTFMVNTLTPDTVPFDGWEPDEHQALLAFAVGCLDENNRDQAMSMTQLLPLFEGIHADHSEKTSF
ncbi:unnamed protein product [Calicophoron daubneyi]|uniref:Protein kinase domain-containing protein n=1 Tax=Calicophoron daubneyi TaxID=300641 RepID=A0AAV2T988_CALDB